jgi:hypothetical protein
MVSKHSGPCILPVHAEQDIAEGCQRRVTCANLDMYAYALG